MLFFFFQAEDGIRDRSPSRGLGDVYKRQHRAFSGQLRVFRPANGYFVPGLRLPAAAPLSLASRWPLPQQLLPVSATGGGRRCCPLGELARQRLRGLHKKGCCTDTPCSSSIQSFIPVRPVQGNRSLPQIPRRWSWCCRKRHPRPP